MGADGPLATGGFAHTRNCGQSHSPATRHPNEVRAKVQKREALRPTHGKPEAGDGCHHRCSGCCTLPRSVSRDLKHTHTAGLWMSVTSLRSPSYPRPPPVFPKPLDPGSSPPLCLVLSLRHQWEGVFVIHTDAKKKPARAWGSSGGSQTPNTILRRPTASGLDFQVTKFNRRRRGTDGGSRWTLLT